MYIYVIKCGDKFKIGKSEDVKTRLSALQTSNPEKLELINSYLTDHPNIDEKELHQRFKPKHLNGEWFDLNSHDLSKIDQYFNRKVNYIKIPKRELKRLKQLKNIGKMEDHEHLHIYIKNLARKDAKQFCLNDKEKEFLDERVRFYYDHYMFRSEDHLDALKEIFFSELHKSRVKNQINDIHKNQKQIPALEEKALKNLILIDNRLNMLRRKLSAE